MVDGYQATVARLMATFPEPWQGHPQGCRWQPLPNLVTTYRRGGFLWHTKVSGGSCTGCGWRVEGQQWRALVRWTEERRTALVGGSASQPMTTDERPR